MADIKRAETLTAEQLAAELARGGKIVLFEYTISVVVLTFKRSSAPHLVRAGESAFTIGLPYTLISLFFGWWGIPWGFIYTPMALFTNLNGGRDVSPQVAAVLPR